MKIGKVLGDAFENKIAKILSAWYHGGKGPKVFFRQSGSGGKVGFRGDLRPPSDLNVHIECKKVQTWKLEDLLNGKNRKEQGIEGWWDQATGDSLKRVGEDGGKPRAVWLIFKKNHCPEYIAVNYNYLTFWENLKGSTYPCRKIDSKIISMEKGKFGVCTITIMRLTDFLSWLKPSDIKTKKLVKKSR